MAASPARRRQRSTRLVVAVALLGLAALLVAGSFATQAGLVRALAAVAAVMLGAAATRITHSELLQTRRDWARDRAEQAQAYHALDTRRAAEHRAFVTRVSTEAREREEVLAQLETELAAAQRRVADAQRKFNAEARRADLAEDENVRLGRQLEESDERAAEAIVHLAELEQEVDVLRSELAAWQALQVEQQRKHA